MHTVHIHILTPCSQSPCAWKCPGTHQRRACTKASSSDNAPNSRSDPVGVNDVLERIRKAKEYREAKDSKGSPNSSSKGQQLSSLPVGSALEVDEYSQRLASQAEELAKEQEESFVSTLQRLEDQDASILPGSTAAPETRSPPRSNAISPKRASRTLEAKLRNPENRATELQTLEQAQSATQGPGSAEGTSGFIGNDSKAASFLEEVMTRGQDDAADIRPEKYTLLKEERQKAQGVEFITKDPNYDPNNVGTYTYKPKVSTWGVFPRPDNISKAFGGGRTYRPGEEPKVAQESKDRLAAALLDYRKNNGTFMEPALEDQCQVVFAQGMQLLQMGNLSAAALQFDNVIEAVPPGSKLGGEAQLQRAIALDSAGKHDEAYKIYLSLERHPANEVQKRAKRMLFGFRAADNLKVKTMSYAAGRKEDYDKYFLKMTGQWNSGYVADEEQDPSSGIIAAFVLLTPLLLCLALIFNR